MAIVIFDHLALGFMAVNVLLTVVLIAIYLRNAKLIKSKMTLGMLFFAAAFLIENALSFFFYNTLLATGMHSLTTFNLVLKAIEMAGLLVLLYVTWE